MKKSPRYGKKECVKNIATICVLVLCMMMTSILFGAINVPKEAKADDVSLMRGKLPYPVTFTCSIWDGEYAFIFGGANETGGKDQILRYDPESDVVTVMSTKLPFTLNDCSSVWNGEYAYIIGGYISDPNTRSDKILRYNTENEDLTIMSATLPTARSSTAAAWDGNYIWIFGGYDGFTYFDTILRYDPSSDTLVQMTTTLPRGIKWNSAIYDGEYIFIFGGRYSDSGFSDEIFRYDPETDQITTMSAKLPTGRQGTSAVWDGRYAYIFGGTEFGSIDLDNILRYDPTDDNVMLLSEKLPSARCQTSTVWTGSVAYIFGGNNRTTQFDEIVRFKPTKLTVETDKSTYFPSNTITLQAKYTGENASTVTFEIADPDDTTILVITQDIIWEPGEWMKYAGNPVLDLGTGGEWDDFWVAEPTVLYIDGIYKMWYTGTEGGPYTDKIGYATSTDGFVWNKYLQNPVLNPSPPETWDDTIVGHPYVIFNGDEYLLYYSALTDTSDPNQWRIGVANSSDGINWIKSPLNPIIDLGTPGSWDDGSIPSCSVVYHDGIYRMWYTGSPSGGINDAEIGYATSNDGYNWNKYPTNPVFHRGGVGTWDANLVTDPEVRYDGATYYLWYRGGNDVGNFKIGSATSNDGINWVKDANNPILSSGDSGSWDSSAVFRPSVLEISNKYSMWFTGYNLSNARIGLATAPFNTSKPGTASTTFTLPSDASPGTYTVYASCIDATATTTFEVIGLGLRILDVTIPTEIHPGDSVDFEILIENGFEDDMDILVMLQVLDPNKVPLLPVYEYVNIDAESIEMVTLTLQLPLDSPVGTYFAQTQLLTEFPRDGGYALDYRNDNFEVI